MSIFARCKAPTYTSKTTQGLNQLYDSPTSASRQAQLPCQHHSRPQRRPQMACGVQIGHEMKSWGVRHVDYDCDTIDRPGL